jgi:hypothetical protein
LQRQLPEAQALAIAEAYLEDGRQIEAVDFLKAAGATEKLEALLEEATVAGDAFLLRSVAATLSVTPDAARWKRLAEAAEAKGKSLYAELGHRKAEIDES